MKKTILFSIFVSLITLNSSSQEWVEIMSGTTKKLNTIEFVGNNIGYVGGDDSLLLKTTDGGATWNEVTYTGVTFYPSQENILKLDFVDENVGFMTIGPYSGTYKTVDGGLTWEQLFVSIGFCYNQGLFFFDENNGFVGGAGCFQSELVQKLENGIWSEIQAGGLTSSSDLITDLDFLNPLFGLAASSGGSILRTTDGGLTWERYNVDVIDNSLTPENNEVITAIEIISDMVAVATFKSNFFDPVYYQGGKIISYDGGITWTLLEESHPANDVHLSAAGITYVCESVYSCGMMGQISSTSDFITWNYDFVNMPMYAITSLPNMKVFAVGEYGTILMKESHSGSASIVSIEEEKKFTVFPNPVGNDLTFSLLPVSQRTTVYVVDLQGKTVLVTDMSTKILDVSKLSSGMYHLLLISDENQFQTSFVKE